MKAVVSFFTFFASICQKHPRRPHCVSKHFRCKKVLVNKKEVVFGRNITLTTLKPFVCVVLFSASQTLAFSRKVSAKMFQEVLKSWSIWTKSYFLRQRTHWNNGSLLIIMSTNQLRYTYLKLELQTWLFHKQRLVKQHLDKKFKSEFKERSETVHRVRSNKKSSSSFFGLSEFKRKKQGPSFNYWKVLLG